MGVGEQPDIEERAPVPTRFLAGQRIHTATIAGDGQVDELRLTMESGLTVQITARGDELLVVTARPAWDPA